MHSCVCVYEFSLQRKDLKERCRAVYKSENVHHKKMNHQNGKKRHLQMRRWNLFFLWTVVWEKKKKKNSKPKPQRTRLYRCWKHYARVHSAKQVARHSVLKKITFFLTFTGKEKKSGEGEKYHTSIQSPSCHQKGKGWSSFIVCISMATEIIGLIPSSLCFCWILIEKLPGC